MLSLLWKNLKYNRLLQITIIILTIYVCYFGVWNAYFNTPFFQQGKPWLLDFFDQIQFYPVSEEELAQARNDFPLGRYDIDIEETTLSLSAYQAFLAEEPRTIMLA